MNKKLIIVALLFFLHSPLVSRELIKGDNDAPEGQTFSFGINKTILGASGSFYVGANQPLENNKQFALSGLARGANAFSPLAPETVHFNGSADISNPLFGQKILALSFLETEDGLSFRDIPVVVAENDPAKVYLLENINRINNIVMLASQNVHDANGTVSSGIIDITTDIKNYVFAAVKPASGEFGDSGSGIALLVRGTVDIEQDGKKVPMRIFSEISAITGLSIDQKALAIDDATPAFFINQDLSAIVANHVALHWDTSLNRLFIGLQVVAGNDANDGARAIAIVRFKEGGGLELQSIVPDTVFIPGSTDALIGAIGSNQQISIHTLKTMYTSTALHYLIGVGGVGNSTETRQSVFALPLVNSGDAMGTIAAKDAQPTNIFKKTQVHRFVGRIITEGAITPEQMPQSTDNATKVGGGILAAGPIQDIIVRDDTVFAYVAEGDSGVYSSQAIFDVSGKIIAWTQWQRAAGTTEQIFAAALNPFEGNFILASGESADTVNVVQKTTWSNGAPQGLQPLTSILNTTFASDNGGVQGMQTFLPFSPGIQNIALLIAGGIGSLVIAQTGLQDTNDIIIPTNGPDFNELQEFTNGSITDDVNAKTVIISGGALTRVGPITALEIAQSDSSGLLFAGGSHGLTVLVFGNGTGWNAATQLSNNLTGLQTGMRFMPVGNYNFVKKLVSDSGFLYVITHDKIDRINLNTSDFSINKIDAVTIASIGNDGVNIRGGFLDGIFSQALALVATTGGLLRIGDDKDVRTIINQEDAQWTEVIIPEGIGAPQALYTVTQTNRAQDITRNNGGYFYVLTADASLDQSRINRFAVQPLGLNNVISSTTIQPFDDLFVEHIPSFLLSFGEYRSAFATDGALYFAMRNQHNNLLPIVLLTPPSPVPRVGVANVGDRSIPVNINIQQGSEINYFSRSQASGSWIAAGNFNTQVLE